MDSPAEYVAQLERDLALAKSRAAQLERELAAADELRGAVASAAVDTAGSMEVALGKLELWKPVVEAAEKWFHDASKSNQAELYGAVGDMVETFSKKASA